MMDSLPLPQPTNTNILKAQYVTYTVIYRHEMKWGGGE